MIIKVLWQKSDFIENFHLYAVNSTFTSELQVIIY